MSSTPDHPERKITVVPKDGDGPSPPRPADWKADLIRIARSKAFLYGLAALFLVVAARLAFNWYALRQHGILALTVHVTHPVVRGVDRTLTLPGNVEAIEQATLYAHVSGYLKKIHVDEGDTVKKDQLLAQIDAPDILQDYRKAKADYDLKEVTLKRYDQLLREKVVSQQEFDTIEAQASQAKAHFANAQANLEYTQVRAPFAGAIARRFKYPGDFISAPAHGGAPSALFLIVNEGKLRIAVNVPQKEVAHMIIGQVADTHVDTFPDRSFAGKVSRLDALLDDSTKTQRVLIDIDNESRELRAGMFATITLHVQRKDNVLAVPREALREEGGHGFVLAVRDGKIARLPVVAEAIDAALVEIEGKGADAPKAQDELVLGGSQALVDGEPVEVLK